MGRDRAAYMREYRKRRRDRQRIEDAPPAGTYPVVDSQSETGITFRSPEEMGYVPYAKRIAELEAEVRHLKAELAKRPMHSFGVPRPAPKPSQVKRRG